MPIETDSQINNRLEEIRDETAPSGNTKTRIYQALKNIYDTVKDLVNNISGTRNNSFEIQLNSQNQDVDGDTLIVLRGGQGGGTDSAIRNHWDAAAGTTVLQFCLNYTGTGSDVWEEFGAPEPVDIARATNDKGLMANYDVRAITDGIIPPGADTTEIEWVSEPSLSTEAVAADPGNGVDPGFFVNVATGVSMKQGGITYTHNGSTLKAWFDPAPANRWYIGYVYADHLGGVGANEIRIFATIADQDREDTGASTSYIYPNRILVCRVRVFNDSIELLGGAQVKRVKTASGAIIEPKQDGTLLLPGIVYKTGTVVDFQALDTEFGTEAAPETGNITAAHGGAVVGHMAFMIHNSGVEPTFGSEFHKIAGSGDYELGVKNYIYFDYRSATRINYSITQ